MFALRADFDGKEDSCSQGEWRTKEEKKSWGAKSILVNFWGRMWQSPTSKEAVYQSSASELSGAQFPMKQYYILSGMTSMEKWHFHLAQKEEKEEVIQRVGVNAHLKQRQ